MLLFHALSAHFQPRGDPTSWTSSSPSSGCSYRRAWWCWWTSGDDTQGPAAPPGTRSGPSTPSHGSRGVRVWVQHCPAGRELHMGQERQPAMVKTWAHWANITLSLEQRDQKNQNRIHLHKIQIFFELCINRRRFWLAFSKGSSYLLCEMGKWVCYFAWGCIQKM